MDREELITEDFLVANRFKQFKVGAGSFPWYYEDDDMVIYIVLFADSGDYPYIEAENKNTHKRVKFENTHRAPYRLRVYDLEKCINFVFEDED